MSTPNSVVAPVRFTHSMTISMGPPRSSHFKLVARNLVASRCQLLMVSRYSSGHKELTTYFCIHLMSRANDSWAAIDKFRWVELHELDGRSIFMTQGCSHCFESEDHDGLREGMYYIDDQSFGQWRMLCYGLSPSRDYQLEDNGHWCSKTKSIVRTTLHTTRSSYSLPPWIIHRPT